MRKHKPEVGGYYVVYKDGYKSFSPAAAFDEGYTLIAETKALTADVSAVGPVDGFNEPHPEGSYVRICVDKQVVRISCGAAEVLAAELLGAIGKL